MVLRRQGGVVKTVDANATAQALIAWSQDEHLKNIDLESSSWAKSLFHRMGFVKPTCTTSKPEILKKFYQHQIVRYVEEHSILPALIPNFDQTQKNGKQILKIYSNATNLWGKAERSIPWVKFPDSFLLSSNEKFNYWNYWKGYDIRYIEKQRANLQLPDDQPALLILDMFSIQMTEPVIKKIHENSIKLVKVPPNMTQLFQPLDLTVNGA